MPRLTNNVFNDEDDDQVQQEVLFEEEEGDDDELEGTPSPPLPDPSSPSSSSSVHNAKEENGQRYPTRSNRATQFKTRDTARDLLDRRRRIEIGHPLPRDRPMCPVTSLGEPDDGDDEDDDEQPGASHVWAPMSQKRRPSSSGGGGTQTGSQAAKLTTKSFGWHLVNGNALEDDDQPHATSHIRGAVALKKRKSTRVVAVSRNKRSPTQTNSSKARTSTQLRTTTAKRGRGRPRNSTRARTTNAGVEADDSDSSRGRSRVGKRARRRSNHDSSTEHEDEDSTDDQEVVTNGHASSKQEWILFLITHLDIPYSKALGLARVLSAPLFGITPIEFATSLQTDRSELLDYIKIHHHWLKKCTWGALQVLRHRVEGADWDEVAQALEPSSERSTFSSPPPLMKGEGQQNEEGEVERYEATDEAIEAALSMLREDQGISQPLEGGGTTSSPAPSNANGASGPKMKENREPKSSPRHRALVNISSS